MYKFENLTIFANKLESANFETKSEIGRGDCYTLIIFQSKVEFSYDGKEYFLIPPNSIILYTPMTMHAYKSCDNGFLNSFICFKIDSEYFKQFEFPFDTIFFANDETIKELVYIIDRISFIHNTDFELQNRSNIPNLLNTFFYTLNSAYLKTKYLNTSVKQNQLVFLDLRNKMIKDPVTYTVNRMTNEAGYTSTYFGICYKNYFGITPSHDRQQQLVKLIKRYLETTNMSLEQIAEACDIKSLSYLISLFKRFENTTPQKYRILKQKHGNQKATPPRKIRLICLLLSRKSVRNLNPAIYCGIFLSHFTRFLRTFTVFYDVRVSRAYVQVRKFKKITKRARRLRKFTCMFNRSRYTQAFA